MTNTKETAAWGDGCMHSYFVVRGYWEALRLVPDSPGGGLAAYDSPVHGGWFPLESPGPSPDPGAG